MFIAATAALPQAALPPHRVDEPDQHTESEHRQGPDGFVGWTLDSPIPDHPDERFPFTLVIARNGKVIRKIDGNPFVWDWIFWDNGRKVAYESGPLHFGLQCTLVNVRSGKKLASYDCFHGIPENPPAWLKALENAR
jgi:hypothetical protein